MPESAYQSAVYSNPATDFIEALATNAMSANVDLTLPNGATFWFIRAFTLIATENLQFELALFSKAVNATGVILTENFISAWQFSAMQASVPASPGYPSGADGLFKFAIEGNKMPYRDLDQAVRAEGPAKLHVRLINRSTASKTAGVPGAVQLITYVSPQGMQV